MKAAVLAFVAISVTAQESRFEVRSRLVTVTATVTDAQGRVMDGLEAANFEVLDNGRPQKITVDTIGTGVAPIALVIAVQSSGISSAVLEKVQKAAGMIQPLITGERGCAALVSFSERVTWLQDCTNAPAALAGAFRKLRPGEYRQARMLDAATAAIAHLSKQQNARRILLFVSESRDRGSESELSVVTAAAQSAGVTVYAATYSALKTGLTSKTRVTQQPPKDAPPIIPNPHRTWDGEPASSHNPEIPPPEDRMDLGAGLAELARLRKIDTTQVLTGGTGGRTLPFARQKGLEDALEKLGSELHQQYVLTFVPELFAPGYHTLKVRVLGAGGFHVRARPGYWSSAEPR